MKHRQLFQLLLFAALLGVGACRSTKQYADFAQAGSTYAAALNQLLTASLEASIDSHSEQMITDRALLTTAGLPGFLSGMESLNKADAARSQVLTDIGKHTLLLEQYFKALYSLATSEEPTKIATSATGLATALNKVGDQLRGQQVIPINVSPITNLIVSAKIRKVLKDEISKNQQLIRKELATQDALLNSLTAAVENDLQEISNRQKIRLETSIEAGVPADAEQWKKYRRNQLTAQLTIKELRESKAAAKKLHDAFEDLIKGGDARTQLAALIGDLELLMKAAESITENN